MATDIRRTPAGLTYMNAMELFTSLEGPRPKQIGTKPVLVDGKIMQAKVYASPSHSDPEWYRVARSSSILRTGGKKRSLS
jgi:hypothetical protein